MPNIEERVETLETRVRGLDGLTNDHGKLAGLDDDDHSIYHTDTRGDARYIKKDGTTADISADIPLNNNKLTGVTDPTANQDAATKKYVDNTESKFGGTGADGVGAITGDTNLDFDSNNVLIKNYTSLTIDATKTLGATNVPSTGGVMILRVSGNCVINGGIDMGGQGGDGGAGGTSGHESGYNGIAGYKSGMFDDEVHYGVGSAADTPGGGGGGHQSLGGIGANGGAGGAAILGYDEHIDQDLKAIFFVVGSGAGGGGYSSGSSKNGGAGGSGGGVTILEVAGNLTFGASSTLDADGIDGGDGQDQPIGAGGAGGGGSGGQLYVLYSGTLTDGGVTTDVGGGAGGEAGGPVFGGAGGNGDYYIAKNHTF